MTPTRKIATCCYCGAKTMLVLSGLEQRKLSCGSCGAPLSKMKPIKDAVAAEQHRAASTQPSHGSPKPRKRPAAPAQRGRAEPPTPRRRSRPPKRRPSWGRRLSRMFEDVFDELEDFFD